MSATSPNERLHLQAPDSQLIHQQLRNNSSRHGGGASSNHTKGFSGSSDQSNQTTTTNATTTSPAFHSVTGSMKYGGASAFSVQHSNSAAPWLSHRSHSSIAPSPGTSGTTSGRKAIGTGTSIWNHPGPHLPPHADDNSSIASPTATTTTSTHNGVHHVLSSGVTPVPSNLGGTGGLLGTTTTWGNATSNNPLGASGYVGLTTTMNNNSIDDSNGPASPSPAVKLPKVSVYTCQYDQRHGRINICPFSGVLFVSAGFRAELLWGGCDPPTVTSKHIGGALTQVLTVQFDPSRARRHLEILKHLATCLSDPHYIHALRKKWAHQQPEAAATFLSRGCGSLGPPGGSIANTPNIGESPDAHSNDNDLFLQHNQRDHRESIDTIQTARGVPSQPESGNPLDEGRVALPEALFLAHQLLLKVILSKFSKSTVKLLEKGSSSTPVDHTSVTLESFSDKLSSSYKASIFSTFLGLLSEMGTGAAGTPVNEHQHQQHHDSNVQVISLLSPSHVVLNFTQFASINAVSTRIKEVRDSFLTLFDVVLTLSKPEELPKELRLIVNTYSRTAGDGGVGGGGGRGHQSGRNGPQRASGGDRAASVVPGSSSLKPGNTTKTADVQQEYEIYGRGAGRTDAAPLSNGSRDAGGKGDAVRSSTPQGLNSPSGASGAGSPSPGAGGNGGSSPPIKQAAPRAQSCHERAHPVMNMVVSIAAPVVDILRIIPGVDPLLSLLKGQLTHADDTDVHEDSSVRVCVLVILTVVVCMLGMNFHTGHRERMVEASYFGTQVAEGQQSLRSNYKQLLEEWANECALRNVSDIRVRSHNHHQALRRVPSLLDALAEVEKKHQYNNHHRRHSKPFDLSSDVLQFARKQRLVVRALTSDPIDAENTHMGVTSFIKDRNPKNNRIFPPPSPPLQGVSQQSDYCASILATVSTSRYTSKAAMEQLKDSVYALAEVLPGTEASGTSTHQRSDDSSSSLHHPVVSSSPTPGILGLFSRGGRYLFQCLFAIVAVWDWLPGGIHFVLSHLLKVDTFRKLELPYSLHPHIHGTVANTNDDINISPQSMDASVHSELLLRGSYSEGYSLVVMIAVFVSCWSFIIARGLGLCPAK